MNPESTPDAIEIELKFAVRDVEVDQVQAVLPSSAHCLHTRTLANRYFDTADGRLHASGVAIRTRSVESTHEMTVKIREPDEGGLTRRKEWNLPVAVPELDRDQLMQLPLPNLVRDLVQTDRLQVAFENTLRRTDWRVQWGACDAMVSLDLGEVRTKDSQSLVSEIEIESLAGPVSDLIDLGLEIADRLPCFMGVISKAERGERLLRHADPQADDDPTTETGWLYRMSRMLDPLAGPSPKEAIRALAHCAPEAVVARFEPLLSQGLLPPGLGRWMLLRSLEGTA